MAASEKELTEVVRVDKGGNIKGCYGPSTIGQNRVWEIWTYMARDEEYEVRYVADEGSGSLIYFSNCQFFCDQVARWMGAERHQLERTAKALTNENEKLKGDRTVKMIRLAVAGIVFITCVGVLLYLLANSEDLDGRILWLFGGGLIAAGSVMFFGSWQAIKMLSGLQGTRS